MKMVIAFLVVTCPIWLPMVLAWAMERRPSAQLDSVVMRAARRCGLPVDG